MMTLELASIPLAFLAGILSIMSPCVWPTLGAAIALALELLSDWAISI
jgi:cytochrome c-type biogenesis protein